MPFARAVRSISASPVSKDEFASALWRTFEASLSNPTKTRPYGMRWGIAVSGGVDSMSAAYLCAQMQEQDPNKPHFTAFVVDHNARKESAEESEKVVKMLHALGLEAHKILLTWPEHVVDPLRLTNFETLARKMRFRALGHACAKHDIRSLILGHHANDMVETAVLRLLKGGSPDVAHDSGHIPECKGIPFVDNFLRHTSSCEDRHSCRQHDNQLTTVGLAEKGITIYKPLQQFGKERLVSTCLAKGVGWIEDRTNQDPSLTPRNAIRFLFSHHTMPQALRDASLRQLAISKSKTLRDADARAMNCLQRLDGFLDLPSGILTINFRSQPGEQKSMDKAMQKMSEIEFSKMLEEETLTSIALVKLITRMVQPYSILGNEKTKRILTRLLETTRSLQHKSAQNMFNLGNVQWCYERGPCGCSWQIYRQQPARGTDVICPEWTADDFGQWKLFDDRFWVRVEHAPEIQSGNSTGAANCSVAEGSEHRNTFELGLKHGLEVRLLRKQDLSVFRRKLRLTDEGKNMLKAMNHVLWTRLPGNSRWSLPVIAVKDIPNAILGFATLNWHLQGVQRWFRWEAKYAHTFMPEIFLHRKPNQKEG